MGGAIEFVKELEHHLQSLEAQKLQPIHEPAGARGLNEDTTTSKFLQRPFSQFFLYPQYTWSQIPNKYTSKTKAAIADIEVTLIETHANLRILSRRSPRQLSKLVAGFQALYLPILHLNVTTMDPLVLYSISAKVRNNILLLNQRVCTFVLRLLHCTWTQRAAERGTARAGGVSLMPLVDHASVFNQIITTRQQIRN